MNYDRYAEIEVDDQFDCIGDFCQKDTICWKWCALSLRCAIEKEQNARLEMLEDLNEPDEAFLKIQ